MEHKNILLFGSQEYKYKFLNSLKEKNFFDRVHHKYYILLIFTKKNTKFSIIYPYDQIPIETICETTKIDYIICFTNGSNKFSDQLFDNPQDLETMPSTKNIPYITITQQPQIHEQPKKINMDMTAILANNQGSCWKVINHIFNMNVFEDGPPQRITTDDNSQPTPTNEQQIIPENEPQTIIKNQQTTMDIPPKNDQQIIVTNNDPQTASSITKLIELGTKTISAEEIRLKKLSIFINNSYDRMISSEKEYYMISLKYFSPEATKLISNYFTHHGFTCELCDGDMNLLIKY